MLISRSDTQSTVKFRTLKLMNHDISDVGITPHFSNLCIDFEIYLNKYWENINIYIIDREKLFDRSADNK